MSTAVGNAAAPSSIIDSKAVVASEFTNVKDDYVRGEIIGRGATAVVYSAIFKPTNVKIAIKAINLENYGANIDEIRKEIQVMAESSHSNVVTYYTSFVVKQELWLIMRLLRGGSMLEIMKRDFANGLEEVVIATVLRDTLKGLEYFHLHGQIHRDVKAGNILVDADGTIQLADFGVSSHLVENGERKGVRQTFVGTPCWMAPEVMEQANGYNYKADIWSFGITALELASGQAPFAKYPPMKVLMLTLQNDPPTLNRNADGKHKYSKSFKAMIDSCLQKDPNKRPPASELLKHSFFKASKDKKFLVKALLREKSAPSRESYKPGQSGVFSRNQDGEWDFSDHGKEQVGEAETEMGSGPTPLANPEIGAKEDATMVATDLSATMESNENAPVTADTTEPVVNSGTGTLSLKLRINNGEGQHKLISFVFNKNTDTPVGIASELADAGLVHSVNAKTVASNIAALLKMQPASKEISFDLIAPDAPAVIGDNGESTTVTRLAKLSIAE